MKVFIPMAGRGARLKPFTLKTPKPLINVAGRPIVSHLINQIALSINTKIEEIIYIIGDECYFDDKIIKLLEDISNQYNAKTKIYRQIEKLGTGHAIMCAKESLNGPAIIAYADTLIHGRLTINDEVDGLIWVKEVKDPSSYGVVRLNSKSNIIELVEKPETYISNKAVVGIYYFKDAAILREELRPYLNQKLSPGEEYLLNFGIEKMIEKDYIFKSQIIENWMDCGTPKLIINSNSKMLTLLTPEPVGYKKEGSVEVIEPVFMGKNITISNSTIGPGVTINDNVEIKNSNISSSIIMENSKISNTELKNSLIGSNTIFDGKFKNIYLGDYSKVESNDDE